MAEPIGGFLSSPPLGGAGFWQNGVIHPEKKRTGEEPRKALHVGL